MPEIDIALQLELSARLLVAAVLGAAIGVEREMHDHPAGMRTHLLVALGSAIFTELSIFGFGDATQAGGASSADASRVAAQIVSGIGFLGAGAIIKYGTSIRGLTTAASLWATAAIGMAAGAGSWIIGAVGTVIVLLSLGPLQTISGRLISREDESLRLRLMAARLDAVGTISRQLNDRRVEIAGISTERLGKNRYEIDLDLRLPGGVKSQDIVAVLGAIPEVEIVDSGAQGD